MANKSCPGASAQINTDQSIDALTNSHDLAAAELSLQTFLDQYHLKALVLPFTGPPNIHWANVEENDLPVLIAFGKVFICEYAKYSRLWVSTSRIRQVAFVKDLNLQQTDQACLAEGLVSFPTWTVYHTVECPDVIAHFMQHSVHHEFWHTMAASVGDYDDQAWVAFNDPGFVYGKQNYPPSGGIIVHDHPRPGFVSTYAMTNVNEDQAETYATLLIPEEYKDLVAWTTTDPILKKKVDYLKQLIVNYEPALNAYIERAGQ